MAEDPKDESDPSEVRQLSRKEAAREFRKQAYKKAKERRKTDPKFLAQKERAKEIRKAAYAAAKERNKIRTKELKEKAKKDRQAAQAESIRARDQEILEALKGTAEIKEKVRPHLKLVKS